MTIESCVRTIVVEFHGSDDAFDAAFPAIPSVAADDPGMTSGEVLAEWATYVLTRNGIQVVVR